MDSKLFIKSALVGASVALLAACGTTTSDDASNKFAGRSTNVKVAGLGNSSSFPGANAGKINPATGERYNTVYFNYDSSTVAEKYMNIVRANANYLKSHPNAKLRLEGNTDPRGSREYNVGLGERRGNGVEDTMEMLGVPRKQLVVVSYGKEKLAAPGNTEEDYKLDRRVEMAYEKT